MSRWKTLRNALPSSRTLGMAFWPIALTIGINDNILEITPINGRSMSPTLSKEYHETHYRDYVAWRKWQPTRDLQRGDIVLYNTPHNPESSAVKRVIALGGDTVILDRRRRPGLDEDGEVNELETTAKRNWDALGGRITVPYGHVWVEGDNWRHSLDSNHFGPISRSLIVGKAVAVLWPWRKVGTKPWEKMYHGRTKVVAGREDSPGEWEDLVSRGSVR